MLNFLSEQLGSVIDNLNKAERLGYIDSAQYWLETRALRNQLIHEYIKDMNVLATALNEAHLAVPYLVRAMQSMVREVQTRMTSSH